jgi:glycosyltransferase involved in cell wall biosynthesis
MTGMERYTLDVMQHATNPYHLILGSRSTGSDKAAQVGHQRGWPVGRVTGPSMFAEQVGTGLYLRRHRRGIRGIHYFSITPGLVGNGTHPFSITIHDVSAWRMPETMSRGMRYMYRPLLEHTLRSPYLRGVMTVSEFSRHEIGDLFGLDANRIVVVYPSVSSIRTVSPTPVAGINEPFFLHVGTVEPRKNLAMLLAGFTSAGRSDAWLYLVGRLGWGSLGPLPVNASYLGPLGDSELAWLYQHAIALVSTSHYEGFGLPVAESLMLGCQVFLHDIPVFRELFAHNSACHFFRTEEELVDLLRIPPSTDRISYQPPETGLLDTALQTFHQ